MNDDQLKNIIQKSSITTTDSFTKNLLNKIEIEQRGKALAPIPFRNVLYPVLLISVLLVAVAYVFPIGSLFGFFKIMVSHKIVLGLIVFMSLVAINHILRLKRNLLI